MGGPQAAICCVRSEELSELRKARQRAGRAACRSRRQLAALRFTPFRSATVESFLSVAFSSLRFVVKDRTISSCSNASAHAAGCALRLLGGYPASWAKGAAAALPALGQPNSSWWTRALRVFECAALSNARSPLPSSYSHALLPLAPLPDSGGWR